LERGDDYSVEYRVMAPDRFIRWIAARGAVEFGTNGKPLRMRGVAIDITERKHSEEALKNERAFLRQVIDIDPNFIFAKDREGRFTLANQALADAYGTTVENLIGKTDADFNSDIEELEHFRRLDQEVIDTKQERLIPEERITDAKGNVHWLQTVKRPSPCMKKLSCPPSSRRLRGRCGSKPTLPSLKESAAAWIPSRPVSAK